MNKERLIYNLKYTKEKHKNDRVDTFGTDISMMCADVLRVLENCIYIPEGATNGEMIKAMFNDFESALLLQVISKEWWNAPYKREVEE